MEHNHENHHPKSERKTGPVHGHNHEHHIKVFRNRFFVSLILAIPIMLMTSMMGLFDPLLIFSGSKYLVLGLATILFFYGGWPFFTGAISEIRKKRPAMMTLITLGISVAYIYSSYAFIRTSFEPSLHIMDFFWELTSLILIMLLGHWIEMRAVQNASNALQKLAELLPSDAVVLKDGKEIITKLSHVQIGDIVLVKPGEQIPTDGVILDGTTTVNESMLTGESRLVTKKIGSKVIGGSINGNGLVTISVTGTGESGYLFQVVKLVSDAQKDKSLAESRADLVARLLFYAALLVGIVALVIWSLVADVSTGITRAITVLIIACPHALGLAIPLVTARSTSIAAQNGLIIKNRKALEFANKVDIVMMDKTGTLTHGNFAVSHFSSLSSNYTDHEILALMGAIERGSNHPLAVGILNEVTRLELTIPMVTNIVNISGVGLQAIYDTKIAKIVSGSYLNMQEIFYDAQQFDLLASAGNSVSYLLISDVVIGIVAQGDQIKDSAKELVDSLLKQNIIPMMLTGDNKLSAKVVADYLGIASYHAELMPDDKEKIVRKYIEDGKVVLMVGDGVNDAPSLARAQVGIAVGAGTDVAIDSADVILVNSDPSDILLFLKLARQTNLKMIQNLWWGAGYNILAIPLAAGVLAPLGFVLSPAIGAAIMSLSTLIVAINAMTLRIKR